MFLPWQSSHSYLSSYLPMWLCFLFNFFVFGHVLFFPGKYHSPLFCYSSLYQSSMIFVDWHITSTFCDMDLDFSLKGIVTSLNEGQYYTLIFLSPALYCALFKKYFQSMRIFPRIGFCQFVVFVTFIWVIVWHWTKSISVILLNL